MSVIAFGIFLLPGLAFWAWFGKEDRDPLVALAQITGVSLATSILLAELGFLLKLQFSTFLIVMLAVIFSSQIIAGFVRRGIRWPSKFKWYIFIGLPLLGLAIAWRVFQARGLTLPAWVDSQHHYLIVRAIIENGGLPDTLAPYLEMPFYYHYGFHAVAAFYAAVSGLEIGQAMIALGQVLNALIGLSVYAFGKALWKDWRPAAFAALLVSIVTRMPAYYLSWGRYTLTIGMVFLPLAMGLALRMVRKPQRKADIAMLALLTAGTLLSHYFAALLLAIFLITLACVHFTPRLRKMLTALRGLASIITGAVIGLLLALPWLLRVAHYSSVSTGIESNFSSIANGSTSATYIWKLLGPTSNYALLIPALIGLTLALVKGKQTAFSIWSLVVAVLALPWSFNFRPFRPDHFVIILFLPVTLWTGCLFWRIGRWLTKQTRRRWVCAVLILVVLVGWTVWDFTESANILNPGTVMVTEADLDALEWVKANTPDDARFYINTAYWQSNTYRGVDGGGWLLPYTGRWALVPTVFYGFSPDTEMKMQIRDWGEDASEITTCSAGFWELVEETNVGWIYIREGAGSLQPAGLGGCEGIELVYEKNLVFIYQIPNQ